MLIRGTQLDSMNNYGTEAPHLLNPNNVMATFQRIDALNSMIQEVENAIENIRNSAHEASTQIANYRLPADFGDLANNLGKPSGHNLLDLSTRLSRAVQVAREIVATVREHANRIHLDEDRDRLRNEMTIARRVSNAAEVATEALSQLGNNLRTNTSSLPGRIHRKLEIIERHVTSVTNDTQRANDLLEAAEHIVVNYISTDSSSDDSNQVHQQENVQALPEADPIPEEVPVVVRASRSAGERFCRIS